MLTLPPEMFEYVARHVDPKDLCTLRLVNRECASRVLKAYTDAHFTERSFLLYKESLQTLVDIARSKYFGPRLRKVVLCVDRMPGTGFDTMSE